VSVKTVSLVRYPASSRPGMGGAAARAPVQIAARSKKSCLPSTSIQSGPTNRPWPRKTSTPNSSRKRRTESCRLMPARRRRIRSMAAKKSNATVSPPRTPKPPLLRTSWRARAARITPLEGTQPTLRQSPPMRCRSIRATFAPRPAAPAAQTRPAVPAPITTRL